MNNRKEKSLEDTIRELNKKYKNVPSPLKESVQHVGLVPTQKIGGPPSNPLLGNFTPHPKSW